jgi:hypothetical protein
MLLWHAEGILRKNKIRITDWLVPDLSPIENVLAILKNKIFERAIEIAGADNDD